MSLTHVLLPLWHLSAIIFVRDFISIAGLWGPLGLGVGQEKAQMNPGGWCKVQPPDQGRRRNTPRSTTHCPLHVAHMSTTSPVILSQRINSITTVMLTPENARNSAGCKRGFVSFRDTFPWTYLCFRAVQSYCVPRMTLRAPSSHIKPSNCPTRLTVSRASWVWFRSSFCPSTWLSSEAMM